MPGRTFVSETTFIKGGTAVNTWTVLTTLMPTLPERTRELQIQNRDAVAALYLATADTVGTDSTRPNSWPASTTPTGYVNAIRLDPGSSTTSGGAYLIRAQDGKEVILSELYVGVNVADDGSPTICTFVVCCTNR